MCLEEVGLSLDFPDLSVAHIADVDTLVGVEGDGFASLFNFNLYWGDILTWPTNDPLLTCTSVHVVLLVISLGLEKESLLFGEDLNALDGVL